MKYPRTYHFPNSPGGTNDDKRMKDLSSLLNKELIFTEKLDGSNACLTKENVFSRSHNKPAVHPSFNYLKGVHSKIKSQIKENEQIFGEYCFAVHSIKYVELSSYFFVFGIRLNNSWLSFDDLVQRSKELQLETVPVLYKGVFNNEKELLTKVEELTKGSSFFGGEKEGVVCRFSESFLDNSFNKSIAKWVRKDHVKTDEHWMFKEIIKQNLKKEGKHD